MTRVSFKLSENVRVTLDGEPDEIVAVLSAFRQNGDGGTLDLTEVTTSVVELVTAFAGERLTANVFGDTDTSQGEDVSVHACGPDDIDPMALADELADEAAETDDPVEQPKGYRHHPRNKTLRYKLLREVRRQGGLTSKKLAERLPDETTEAVMACLPDLYKQGWVKREGNGSDGYRYYLTDAGRETAEVYERQHAKGHTRLPLGYLSEGDSDGG